MTDQMTDQLTSELAGAVVVDEANGTAGNGATRAAAAKTTRARSTTGAKSGAKAPASRSKSTAARSRTAPAGVRIRDIGVTDEEAVGVAVAVADVPPPAGSETTGEPEEESSAEETQAPGERESRAWAVANPVAVIARAVAVAIAVATAVGLVVALVALGNSDAVSGARTSALASARTYAVELAGYNYQHLNQDFGTVLAHSTPSFRRSFTQTSSALKSTLARFHATAQAKVVSAGLVSGSTSRADVLVFLDQTITNTAQRKPSTDRSQVEITLVNSGGRWLIDQVRLL
jgi:Mce-associated membrane protein